MEKELLLIRIMKNMWECSKMEKSMEMVFYMIKMEKLLNLAFGNQMNLFLNRKLIIKS